MDYKFKASLEIQFSDSLYSILKVHSSYRVLDTQNDSLYLFLVVYFVCFRDRVLLCIACTGLELSI